jgi:hypothetical protein
MKYARLRFTWILALLIGVISSAYLYASRSVTIGGPAAVAIASESQEKPTTGFDSENQAIPFENSKAFPTRRTGIEPAPTGVAEAREAVSVLAASTDARPFVLLHIRATEGYERVLARRLVQDCWTAREVVKIQSVGSVPASSEPNHTATMNRALDVFQRKCGQFSHAELEEFLAIRYASGSPLMMRYNGGTRIESAENRNKLIEELVLSRNPVLFDDLAFSVLAEREADGRFIYFQGKKYNMRDPEIGQALWLVPCHLGLDCTAGSMRYGLACLAGVDCNIPDLNSNNLARNIAAAIKAGDVASFLR